MLSEKGATEKREERQTDEAAAPIEKKKQRWVT